MMIENNGWLWKRTVSFVVTPVNRMNKPETTTNIYIGEFCLHRVAMKTFDKVCFHKGSLARRNCLPYWVKQPINQSNEL